jgi:exodeoxyribonuclease III
LIFIFSKEEHDQEGRLIATEFEKFILVNVYTPNSKPDLSRLENRQEWDRLYAQHLCKLRSHLKKPILACGDFNVAHKEIDLARPMQNDGKHGFTGEERTGFDNLLKTADLTDTYRSILGDTVGYSYWSMANGSRKQNVGWRIDYFLADEAALPHVKKAFILEHVEGSDHAPVGVEVQFP